MSKSKQKSETVKLVEIKFNPKKVQCFDETAYIYGIYVELKGKFLVGKCSELIANPLVEAGKAE